MTFLFTPPHNFDYDKEQNDDGDDVNFHLLYVIILIMRGIWSNGYNQKLQSKTVWVQILALSFPGCVTLDEGLCFSEI